LQARWLNKKDRNSKKIFKKMQPEEVNTHDLPGSNFMLCRREGVDDDNKNKNEEVFEETADEDDEL
jgi:hypothetical protein